MSLYDLVDGPPLLLDLVTPLKAAAEKMLRIEADAAVVVEPTGGVAGLITAREFLHAIASGAGSDLDPVEDWMSLDPATEQGDRHVHHLVCDLVDRGATHIVVLDGKLPVGLLTVGKLRAASRVVWGSLQTPSTDFP